MTLQSQVVLVTEDDSLIREIVSELLVNEGFTCVEAAHAAQAMDILSSGAPRVDVLFTDIRMPGTWDGLDLARHTCLTWPDVRVLITSGHMMLHAGELPGTSLFLPKPYTLAGLVRTIRAFVPPPQAGSEAP